MKKLLLTLLVLFGLQARAQINYCDSLSYTTGVSPVLTVTGNSLLTPNMVDSIIWSWQACNSTMCYAGSGATVSFQNILPTDTVKVCYDAYIYFMGAVYVCTDCDSLVYDANSYSWVLYNMGNTTTVKEIIFEIGNDNKIYDLLGREIFEIPKGTIYIKNRKKFIK
tara:strand:- start:237 stop:734 length:498 start_codon:yes stop_codon:yes gene_type:complete